jgi:type I restriction enzyme M protein
LTFQSHRTSDEALDAEIKQLAIDKLGFLGTSDLFSELAKRKCRRKNNFILGDLAAVLTIEQSTMGAESEDDFGNLFDLV